MTTGSPIKDNDDKKNKHPSKVDDDFSELKAYTFNGKVVIGIGSIMIVAIIITISMGMLSQSPEINL